MTEVVSLEVQRIAESSVAAGAYLCADILVLFRLVRRDLARLFLRFQPVGYDNGRVQVAVRPL